MEEVYTLEEVAKQLKVSVKTVRQWVRTDQLKGFKAGKQWRVRAGDLEAFASSPATGKGNTAE
jgi:putative molybdopterin biosynthesis protein